MLYLNLGLTFQICYHPTHEVTAKSSL